MIKCPSNKKAYQTLEIAEDVLIETRIKFNSGPIAVYQCEECSYFHLTSQGAMNPKLAQYLAEGKIQRQKEANDWLNKLKKK